MDYEKLEKGLEFYNHNLTTNLSQAIENSVHLFRELAAHKKIQFKANIQRNISVMIDPAAVVCVFNNFLDNAIKYTPEGGNIHVTLGLVKTEVEFIVKDPGIGISEEQLKNIFNAYHQISHKKRNTLCNHSITN